MGILDFNQSKIKPDVMMVVGCEATLVDFEAIHICVSECFSCRLSQGATQLSALLTYLSHKKHT